MESSDKIVEFIYGRRYIKLRWNPQTTSEEMIMDAIDSLGRKFMEYYTATFINFVTEDGSIVHIDDIASASISPIYIRAPDAKKNLNISYTQIHDIKTHKFDKKQFFVIENSKLVEENKEIIKEISWAEIGKHSKRKDCWIVINGKVYEITEFIKRHPGGDIIMKSAGKDATLVFNKHHPWVFPETAIRGMCIGIAK
ncbi:hypothetical protein SteCoe_21440 [Stentor coeruleus]|uniref:Cytochrome b5 heme-binding domain-containing protein n=1 Tax=Stentor coeruleus TaxID=5963 RepID=A0A1R2BPB3_9CILI|nr:hypothetical protein SteCoe_21440 [Stentor coeruleus]